MIEIKLSLAEILEKIELHEATDGNKQIATVIITEIFKGKEDER